MSNNKKSVGSMFSKGYYIALILCAVAVGITGYVYYRNTQAEPASVVAADPNQAVAAPADEADPADGGSDVAVIATQPRQEATNPGTAPGTTPSVSPTEAPVKKALQTTAPVSGEAVAGYSMEALSYNQTTRDWRVHNGIDLAAEAGTPVVAAAAGQVYTVYEDDAMGTTVVIRHEGGYNTRYSSLSEDVSVSVGQTVALGQAIGTVGTTALVETAVGPHVHFSVTYQDQPMDPQAFLALS